MRRLIMCVGPIRMGSLICAFVFAKTIVSYSQTTIIEKKPDYNRWSLELLGGFSNAVGPYTPGYSTNLLDLSNIQLGGRYMANRHIGLKLDAEYDLFKNNSSWKGNNSLPFRTNYFRFSLQGVANLHHILEFQEWTKHIGLQFHAGAGYSTMGNDHLSPFTKGRNMVNLMVGVSPIFKINNRFTIKLDATGIKHMHRKYTIDMNESMNIRGMDAFIGTLTLGLQVNLGKAKEHADWYFDKSNPAENAEIKDLKRRLEKLEEMHGDGDLDGIPNYLDKELATPAGSKVDASGVTIPERVDTDNLDESLVKAIPESIRSPKMENEEQDIITTAFNSLEFAYNESTILLTSNESLDALAALLKQKQDWKLQISGHTDNVGKQEENLVLSKERAEAVKDYLVKKGIASERIETQYFGSSKPIATNETEEGRQKNRRVEMKITF